MDDAPNGYIQSNLSECALSLGRVYDLTVILLSWQTH